MDLMQENPIEVKKTPKTKIFVIIIIILIIILLIAAIIIWLYAQQLKSQLFKVNIDGIANSRATSEEGLFIIENNKVYTSISNVCAYVGYTYYPGGYKQYSEDKTKCYVNNSKEIVTFSSGSKEIIKYPADNAQSQKFVIDEEVISRGNKLYVSENGLEKAFNLLIDYYPETNTVSISTLPYLTAYYERSISNASLENSDFSDQIKFNNEKALLKSLIVVKDENTGLYGVEIISPLGEVTNVITPRFMQIEYMEGTDDFIVTTQEKKVGIYGSDGLTKVKPDYDTINVIDKNIGLYLVSSNNKQGVINSNGKIIIHQDYDEIGLTPGSYDDPNVTNNYLLYDSCIPVKINNKWGLIDINGQTIVSPQYDEIGCKTVLETGFKNTTGVVIIPDINGIVVKTNQMGEDERTVIEKYGIINASGEQMINTVLDSVYTVTIADVTTYYITAQNQTIDIVNWWYEQVAQGRVSEQNNQTNQTINNQSNTIGQNTINNSNNV